MTTDAPTDGDVFPAFTKQMRVPGLRPGDGVVMDNLGAHRREAIARAGAQMGNLPACSPDLNPIERMGSKVKEFLQAAKAWTFDALDTAIEAAFQSVTPQDAASRLVASDYTIKQYALGSISKRRWKTSFDLTGIVRRS